MTLITVHRLAASDVHLLGNNIVNAARLERHPHLDAGNRLLAALGERPAWLNIRHKPITPNTKGPSR